MKKYLLGVFLLLAIIFSPISTRAVVIAPPTKAVTVEELQAMIAQLMAQIAALKGDCPTFNQDLSLGDGELGDGLAPEVKKLQKFLISKGYLASHLATGYFGKITKAALARYAVQENTDNPNSTNLLPTDGIFSAPLRANISAHISAQCHSSVGVDPVIKSVSGPASLAVGQTGTWKVDITAPVGTSLKYSVDWGEDESKRSSVGAYTISSTVQNTGTFTHAYSMGGKYTITIKVENLNKGGGTPAVTTMNVVVGGEQGPYIETARYHAGEMGLSGFQYFLTGKNLDKVAQIYVDGQLYANRRSIDMNYINFPNETGLFFGVSPTISLGSHKVYVVDSAGLRSNIAYLNIGSAPYVTSVGYEVYGESGYNYKITGARLDSSSIVYLNNERVNSIYRDDGTIRFNTNRPMSIGTYSVYVVIPTLGRSNIAYLKIGAVGNFTILPTTLPNAIKGQNFKVQLTSNIPSVTNVSSLRWSIISGRLPSGLSLRYSDIELSGQPNNPASGFTTLLGGEIYGTSTESGSFTFTVQAQSPSRDKTATKNYRIVVGNELTPTITLISPQSNTSLTPGAVVGISWRATGSGYDKYQIVVGNSVMNTERQLYDRVSLVDLIPAYQTSFTWNIPDLLNNFARGSSYSFDQIKNAFYLQVKLVKFDRVGGSYVASSNKIPFYVQASSIPTSTPSITVLSPNGGETLVQGQQFSNQFKISWKGNNISKVTANLVPANFPDDGFGRLGVIGAVDASNYSAMYWDAKTVWTDLHNGTPVVVPPGKYKIHLVGNESNDLNRAVQDVSDNYFTISSSPATTCTDSDGGQNYFVKGTTKGISMDNYNTLATYVDVCKSGTVLREYSCNTYSIAETTVKDQTCDNGCSNGACLKAPVTPDADTVEPVVTYSAPTFNYNAGNAGHRLYLKFNNPGKIISIAPESNNANCFGFNVAMTNLCTSRSYTSGSTCGIYLQRNPSGSGRCIVKVIYQVDNTTAVKYFESSGTVNIENIKETNDLSPAPSPTVLPPEFLISSSDSINQMANILDAIQQVLKALKR